MITIEAKQILSTFNKLGATGKSVFPNAVRFTLNDLAYDVKKNTLIPTLKNKSGMTIRSESFFRRYSGFVKATGYSISSMFSQVGMIPSGDASQAVNRLATQEEGGSLKHSNVPLYASRRGSSHKKRVQNKLFWQNIKIAKTVRYGDTQGLIRAVTKTKIERGGGSNPTGIIYGNILYGIRGFKRFRRDNTIKLHLTKLYEYDKDKYRKIKPTRFMQKSATVSGNNMQAVFDKNLATQLKRHGL